MLLDLRLLEVPVALPTAGGSGDGAAEELWRRRPRTAPVFAIDPAVMTVLWAAGEVSDEELIAALDDGGARRLVHKMPPGSRILKHPDSL